MSGRTAAATECKTVKVGLFKTKEEAWNTIDLPAFITITQVYQWEGTWWRVLGSTTTLPSFGDELGMILLPAFKMIVDMLVRLLWRGK